MISFFIFGGRKITRQNTTMAGRGGIRSTSFTSETAPKGNKGAKHRRTVLKEAVGLSGWERLTNYLLNEGADKLCDSLSELKPGQFVIAYQALAEFVKPKLSRTELTGKDGKDFTINIKEV